MTTPANPDDLTAFLRAQLDDDERAARAWLPLGNPTAAERDHIARHDPARVLAEVDAKRRILNLCEIMEADPNFLNAGTILPGDEKELAMRVLMLLALPFAAREGFREEWRA